MTERQFEGFDSVAGTSTAADVEEESREDSQLIDEIVSMGQNLGLEMDSGDVEELLDEHRDELTTEELQQLQEEQKRTLTEEMSSDEDEGRKIASTADIKEICAKWNDIQNFVELYHPDKATSSRAVLKEQPVITSPPPKRLGRETTPPVELPDVFMEEDSPSKK